MSADWTFLGPEAKVDIYSPAYAITPIFYGVVSCRYREPGDGQEVTDSESTVDNITDAMTAVIGTGPYLKKHHKVGNKHFECVLEAELQEDIIQILFRQGASLLGLVTGSCVQMVIWPGGRSAGATVRWKIPQFKIANYDGDAVIRGSPPQRISFSGISNGNYFRPGEAG